MVPEGPGDPSAVDPRAPYSNPAWLDTSDRAAVKGAPVMSPGVLLQKNPMSAMGFSEKNIRKAEDLRGKIVATTPGDSMSQIWPLFLKKTGLKESDFKVVSGDATTKLNAVINGQADLLLGYVMDQSMKIKDATGKDVYPIKFADYGVNLVSSGVIVNREWLNENKDLVKRFMAAATKVAALIVTLRLLVTAFPGEDDLWTVALAVIVCISLAWGNLAAIVQTNVKRLLAYSSISHAGFLLMPIAAGNALGGRALLYYLIPYAAMSVGAFAVVAVLGMLAIFADFVRSVFSYARSADTGPS